ncbi:hypothetical protein CF319_g8176 [Tilletia indica]|nr:hypothetical protein CF319_g8176 [Tilletia indica]
MSFAYVNHADDGNSSSSVAAVPICSSVETFFKWREALEPVLVGVRALEIVRGQEQRPTLPPNATSSEHRLVESWKDRDAKAMSLIRRTVGGAYSGMIRNISSAAGIKLLSLNLTDEGDMTAHLSSFMELVAEADAAGLPWGQEDREKCNRFIDTLPPKSQPQENAERKSSAQRSVDVMAMAAMRHPLKIKGAAKMARGGKPGSSRGRGKGKSYPSPSPSKSRTTAGGRHSAAAYAAYPDADAMLGAFFEPSTDILAASSLSTLVPFMVDSGASQHIVDRADVFINARTTDKTRSEMSLAFWHPEGASPFKVLSFYPALA